MKKKKKRTPQMGIRCPYCGRPVQFHPASYVYGENNLNPESYLYVCNGYPEQCDAYVGAQKVSLKPMGTLANGELRHKRIEAHRALDRIWKEGYMTRRSAYIWLQYRLGLREKDMHIALFSDYYCDETIRECKAYIEQWAGKNRREVKDYLNVGNRKHEEKEGMLWS